MAREQVLKALYYGATAILLKNQERGAFREALALKVSIPRKLPRGEPDGPHAPTPPTCTHEDALTRRERELLDLIGQGFSVARFAVALKLSPHTARVHDAPL